MNFNPEKRASYIEVDKNAIINSLHKISNKNDLDKFNLINEDRPKSKGITKG